VAPLPPPPHAAMPSATIGTAAALAMSLMDRVLIMVLLSLAFYDAAGCDDWGRCRTRRGSSRRPCGTDTAARGSRIGHDRTVARPGRQRNGYVPEIAPSGTPGRRSGRPYPRTESGDNPSLEGRRAFPTASVGSTGGSSREEGPGPTGSGEQCSVPREEVARRPKVDARDTSRRTPPDSPRWSAMSWITRAISARPVDAELAPSVELCRAVTNGFLESYVCWREACEDVRSAYERWGKCKSPQADLTFESYRAALDREDHAARIHAGWAMRLHAVERSATLERAGASFAA